MYIARDKDETVWLYESKPKKDEKTSIFYPTDDLDNVIGLNCTYKELHALFCIDNLTFENSPIELEVKVK